MPVDFAEITELPGTPASREQLAMAYHRYRTALELCAGKDVLEVACGGGQGLGLLASGARRVVGGDYTYACLTAASATYRGAIPLVRLDAQALPFRDASFDVVVMFEAIYYLPDAGRFLDECRRVLRPAGTVILSSVNREWRDFNPSPYSTVYRSAGELQTLLREHGFEASPSGAFAARYDTPGQRLISLARRTAIRFGLIPKTFGAKAVLKRLVSGSLVPLPARLEHGMAAYEPPSRLANDVPADRYKILYAIGCRTAAASQTALAESRAALPVSGSWR